MSKICPNCHAEYDDNHGFCSECGSKLVNKPTSADPALNLGDANAISGGVNINQSKNVTSHDVHYHTIQQSVKPEKEVQQEHYNRYHEEVAKSLKDGIITSEARANLETLKFQLGLDDATASKIEAAVKNERRAQVKATNDGLSIIGKMALKSAVQAIEQNSPQAQLSIRKLAPICKTTMNEQVHFYYSMLLSAFEPEKCVEAYESRSVDSYWLAFWASMAYRLLGDDGVAEAIISEMTGMWQERPEINVILNACIGILLANNGNLEECQDLIIEYLTQSQEEPSEELNDLFQALLHLVGIVEADNPRYAFYNEHFLSARILPTPKQTQKKNEELESKEEVAAISKEEQKTVEPKDTKVNEEAEKIYAEACRATEMKRVLLLQKAADAGSLEAMFDLADCYCDGDGIDKNMSLSIKWLKRSADGGYAKAQSALGGVYFDPKSDGCEEIIEQNLALAEKYLLLAAKKGEIIAQTGLASLYIQIEDYDKAATWARKSAQVGQPLGCFMLGRLYEEGLGVEQNHLEGLKWFEKAADAGDADAQNIVGNIYTNADYVEHDYKKAFENYQKAAAQGHGYGMLNLGLCYRDGEGTDVNILAAEEWIKKAAETGVQEAIDLLNSDSDGEQTDFYGSEENGNPNEDADKLYEEACKVTGAEHVSLLQRSAEAGCAKAMLDLAGCYYDGNGIEEDLALALEWYQKAAEAGNAEAMYSLGLCYENGQGTEVNMQAAVDLYQKAAEADNADAMNCLGICYEDGKGTIKNMQTAFNWYKKAAEAGNAKAMRNLGLCFEDGKGTIKNMQIAFNWYKKAAEAGNADAMRNLGRCFEDGKGTKKNMQTAFNWYKKAAEAGIAGGMNDFGYCYYEGLGVKQDYATALDWFEKALAKAKEEALEAEFIKDLNHNIKSCKDILKGPNAVVNKIWVDCDGHKTIFVHCDFVVNGFKEGAILVKLFLTKDNKKEYQFTDSEYYLEYDSTRWENFVFTITDYQVNLQHAKVEGFKSRLEVWTVDGNDNPVKMLTSSVFRFKTYNEFHFTKKNLLEIR